MQKRILTVTYKPWRSNSVSMFRKTKKLSDFPCVRISGRWLADAGFNINDQFSVELVESGVLVLRKIQTDERKESHDYLVAAEPAH